MADQAGWVATDNQSNATATANKAAESGKQHIIESVDCSFSDNSVADKLLQVKDGADVAWSGYVTGSREVTFPAGISITRGNAASAVLAAGGTGVTGIVNIHGRTR